jgi:hypothetical protein
VKKEGSVGLFIKSKLEEIISAKLLFSDTVNPEGMRQLQKNSKLNFTSKRGQTPLFFYVANSINSLSNLYEIILNKLVKKEK